MELKDRKEYQKMIEDQIREWEATIRALETKAGTAATEAKNEYARQIASLNKKKDEVSGKLKELKGSSDEAWSALKGGITRAVGELKASIEEARTKFK
ncbi:MAG: hypothetical protein HY955_06985 [Deltaproteobacteria bacterium]|nr:hypothetical protein [Deltaproteobacteria bacterium]